VYLSQLRESKGVSSQPAYQAEATRGLLVVMAREVLVGAAATREATTVRAREIHDRVNDIVVCVYGQLLSS
jgi:hypothetical protein